MRWQFTQAEILHAWEELRWDRIPAPLIVRPAVTLQDEWEALQRELRQRLPILDDPDLLPVLRTAIDPDTSLIMIGARKNPLRLYAAATANVGVTMVQRPGPDPDIGGDIIIEVGSPALIPKVCAAVAGDEPAGRQRGMVETWERLQSQQAQSWMVSDDTPLAEQMRALLAAPRTGHGHIEIRLDRRASRQPAPRYLSWFDAAGDGRYTYTRQYGDFHIDPCGSDRFRQLITRLMEP